MVKVYQELDCNDIEDKCWCVDDDFWKVIHEQNLETALENYLEETAPEEDGGYELTDLNDLLRFDGEEVLKSLGADLTGTIWDDSDDDDEDEEEDEEDEEV